MKVEVSLILRQL